MSFQFFVHSIMCGRKIAYLRFALITMLLGLSICVPCSASNGRDRPTRDSLPIKLPTSFGNATITGDRQERLDTAFNRLFSQSGARAISAAIIVSDGGEWAKSVLPDGAKSMWLASVGKLFTATVVHQLAQERRLSLTDHVSRWVKGVPEGDRITIEQLLSHTSGLGSASDDPRLVLRGRHISLDHSLKIVGRQGLYFAPGTNWRYSNTGYDILSAVVEAVDKRPFKESIEERIFQPLGMDSARALSAGDKMAGVAPLWSAKGQAINPTVAGGAGCIVSNARDMAHYLKAFVEGRLLESATISAMIAKLYPMIDEGAWYGQGIMVIDVPDESQTLWIGHLGGAPGASAVLLWSPADRAIVAVAINGDGSAAAVANGLLKEIRSIF